MNLHYHHQRTLETQCIQIYLKTKNHQNQEYQDRVRKKLDFNCYNKANISSKINQRSFTPIQNTTGEGKWRLDSIDTNNTFRMKNEISRKKLTVRRRIRDEIINGENRESLLSSRRRQRPTGIQRYKQAETDPTSVRGRDWGQVYPPISLFLEDRLKLSRLPFHSRSPTIKWRNPKSRCASIKKLR